MSKAQSEARLRMLYSDGMIYAAYSRYCDWIKVGFTSKPVPERVEKLNSAYPVFAPFSLIGTTPGTHRVEQTIHRILKPLRLNRVADTGELYPASRSVVAFVTKMLSYDQRVPFRLEEWWELREWTKRAASHPINRVEAEVCFERFRYDRDPLLTGRTA
jgi:hypothetical protein